MTTEQNDRQELEILTEQAKALIKEQEGKKFSILLTGRTGVGKSSTINSLMNKEVAPVGDFEPTTVTIEKYDSEISNVPFTIFDSPGLCDDLEEKGNDYKYINLMIKNVDKIDCIWFVTRLDDPRVSTDEKKAIKLISQAFGEKVWQKGIIVFTYAGNVKAEQYSKSLEKRTQLIRDEIAKYAKGDIATNVPSVAVDNMQETTPDGETWLNNLFTSTYSRMLKDGALPFLLSLLDRLEPPEPEVKVVYQTRTVYRPSPQPSSTETSKNQQIKLTHGQVGVIIKTSQEIFDEHYLAGRNKGEEEYGRGWGTVVGGIKGGVEGASKSGLMSKVAGGFLGFVKGCRDATRT